MRYQNKKEWIIEPTESPTVKKNCPKCGEKTNFINSKKFRVNANGKQLDIWLIYNCEHCKSNWNMTLYERINPKSIEPELYEKFLANDEELAETIGFDRTVHTKNKSELIFSQDNYKVKIRELEEKTLMPEKEEITVRCDYPISLRMDKLIADTLGLSRSQVKQQFVDSALLKSKVKDGFSFSY